MKGFRWYYRLTLNQTTFLEQRLGPLNNLHYLDALERASFDMLAGKLKRVITDAAERAGDTGVLPLVDDKLVEKLRNEGRLRAFR